MKFEDEQTKFIKDLLRSGKSLNYIKERFSEEYNEVLTLEHIYNTLRIIAIEDYLGDIEVNIENNIKNAFFPKLRFTLRAEPDAEVVKELIDKDWKVVLTKNNSLYFYYKNDFVGEKHIESEHNILDIEIVENFLQILTEKFLKTLYLPSLSIIDEKIFGDFTAIGLERVDNDLYVVFSDFVVRCSIDEFGKIEKNEIKRKISSKIIKPNKVENLSHSILPEKKIKKTKITLAYVLSPSYDLREEEFILPDFPDGNIERNIKKVEKVSSNTSRIRYVLGNSGRRIEKFTGNLENFYDSLQSLRTTIPYCFKYYIEGHPEAVLSSDLKFVLINSSDKTMFIECPYPNPDYVEKKFLLDEKFISLYQTYNQFYILTSNNIQLKIYIWNGNPNVNPVLKCIVDKIDQKIVTGDLYVETIEVPEISSEKEKQKEEIMGTSALKNKSKPKIQAVPYKINQKYSSANLFLTVKDLLLLATENRELLIWSLEGDYCGKIANLKSLDELNNFSKLNSDIRIYILDNTLIVFGNKWISGSKRFEEQVNVCLGGIPEIHNKVNFIAKFKKELKDVFNMGGKK